MKEPTSYILTTTTDPVTGKDLVTAAPGGPGSGQPQYVTTASGDVYATYATHPHVHYVTHHSQLEELSDGGGGGGLGVGGLDMNSAGSAGNTSTLSRVQLACPQQSATNTIRRSPKGTNNQNPGGDTYRSQYSLVGHQSHQLTNNQSMYH